MKNKKAQVAEVVFAVVAFVIVAGSIITGSYVLSNKKTINDLSSNSITSFVIKDYTSSNDIKYIGDYETKIFYDIECYLNISESNRILFKSVTKAVNVGFSYCNDCPK